MKPDEIDEIKGITDDIHRKVPRYGAKVRTHIYGSGENESLIIADRLGYLRLGIEFLKAIFPPIPRNE